MSHHNLRRNIDQPRQHSETVKQNNNKVVHKQQQFVPNPNVNYNVHAFYYPWYCTPETDGDWMHWNHPYLQHWNREIAKRYPSEKEHHVPPDDIGASYYPQLGPYSSADPTIIKQHFKWFVEAKIGVAVVSWIPPHQHDDNGPPIAQRLPQLLDLALEFGIKVAIHMEPYDKRTPESFENDVRMIIEAYGNHPALYKLIKKTTTNNNNDGGDCEFPVLYVYDQYRIPAAGWKHMFQNYGGKNSNGNDNDGDCTSYFPAITLALIVERKHWHEYVLDAGFDGGYTYFASKSFTYGSNPSNWRHLQEQSMTTSATGNLDNINQQKYFVPSVGPGYDDAQVRPWNNVNTHERGKMGNYYAFEWAAAIQAGVSMVSITSFNEWHEGTQIEPAKPFSTSRLRNQHESYRDYGTGGPMMYLDLTRTWVEKLEQHH